MEKCSLWAKLADKVANSHADEISIGRLWLTSPQWAVAIITEATKGTRGTTDISEPHHRWFTPIMYWFNSTAALRSRTEHSEHHSSTFCFFNIYFNCRIAAKIEIERGDLMKGKCQGNYRAAQVKSNVKFSSSELTFSTHTQTYNSHFFSHWEKTKIKKLFNLENLFKKKQICLFVWLVG